MGESAVTTPPARKLVPYTDAGGRQRWVEVEASAAAELDRYDRWARRREARFRATHVLATDVHAARASRPAKDRSAAAVRLVGYLNRELEPAARAAGIVAPGYPWEGPRAAFTLYLGESPTWSGPDSLWVTRDGGETWRCRFCGHYRVMPRIACCLNGECNRTGRDAEIEPGRARRRDKTEASALKGGVG